MLVKSTTLHPNLVKSPTFAGEGYLWLRAMSPCSGLWSVPTSPLELQVIGAWNVAARMVSTDLQKQVISVVLSQRVSIVIGGAQNRRFIGENP